MKNKKKYDREFKLNTIKLHRDSGKSLHQISADIGVPLSTLAAWVKQFNEYGFDSFPGSGSLKPCDDEIYRLRKELSDMKRERDILKKAVQLCPFRHIKSRKTEMHSGL